MPVASKTATSATPSRSKGSSKNSKGGSSTRKIKLKLHNGTFYDETIVALFDDATMGFDGDHDAYKFFGTNPQTPYIYSEISSQKYAINSVSPPVNDPVVIPLSVIIKEAGSYNIDVTEFANLEDQTVMLKHGSIETKLNSGISYTFNSAAGTFTNFQLIIGSTTTGIESPVTDSFRTWYSREKLYLSCPSGLISENALLTISDIQGRTLYSNVRVPVAAGQTVEYPVSLPYGMFIVRVSVDNRVYVNKVVVY
jgi:hypothetical protein